MPSFLKHYEHHQQICDRRIRRGGRGRGARRLRGGAGPGAHGHQDAAPFFEFRQHRLHGLQPLHRRHRQGAFSARDRRAGRGDGRQCRQDGAADAHAQRGQGRGGAEPALAGGQARLPRPHEKDAGKHAQPDHPPERGGGDPHPKREGERRAHHLRRDHPRQSRRARHGRVLERRRHRRRMEAERRPQRLRPRHGADAEPYRPRLYGAAVQDGHPRPRGRAHHRLLEMRAAGRRHGHLSLFVPVGGGAADADALLSDLYQRTDARHHPRQPAPLAAVCGRHQGHGTALLPFHRRQGGALCRQGAAPDLFGTRMRGLERGICAGHELFAAARRAAGHVPHRAGAGTCTDHALCLRHRIRLHRHAGRIPHAGV